MESRKQFGATIGTIQVLQHRLVDMLMVLEQMRSLLVRAVRSASEGSAEAAQMHGGMGMTDELMVGHGMKRLMVIDSRFGNADVQRARFAALAA